MALIVAGDTVLFGCCGNFIYIESVVDMRGLSGLLGSSAGRGLGSGLLGGSAGRGLGSGLLSGSSGRRLVGSGLSGGLGSRSLCAGRRAESNGTVSSIDRGILYSHIVTVEERAVVENNVVRACGSALGDSEGEGNGRAGRGVILHSQIVADINSIVTAVRNRRG